MQGTANLEFAKRKKSGGLFITGTDTNAGKTFVTVRILRFLREQKIVARGFKPVCCGGKDDIFALLGEQKDVTESEINGFYFEAPATPSVAAALEGQSIVPEVLQAWCFNSLKKFEPGFSLWEGAGGWLVPLHADWCVADWAEAIGFPVLLVVAERLGCLNHTLLTVRDIRARGLTLAGIILNQIPGATTAAGDHREVLEKDFGLPVWGRIPEGASELPDEIGRQLLGYASAAEEISPVK